MPDRRIDRAEPPAGDVGARVSRELVERLALDCTTLTRDRVTAIVCTALQEMEQVVARVAEAEARLIDLAVLYGVEWDAIGAALGMSGEEALRLFTDPQIAGAGPPANGNGEGVIGQPQPPAAPSPAPPKASGAVR